MPKVSMIWISLHGWKPQDVGQLLQVEMHVYGFICWSKTSDNSTRLEPDSSQHGLQKVPGSSICT